jgi:hypothetical protein
MHNSTIFYTQFKQIYLENSYFLYAYLWFNNKLTHFSDYRFLINDFVNINFILMIKV